MQTVEILFNDITFKIREHSQNEDRNVLGEVFSEANYPIEQFINCAPKVVVDVGGHIGSFSKRCHSLFPGCKTYTVEPDEENHELCRLNLENENNTLIRGVLNYYPDKVYFYKSIKEATGGGFLTNELIPTKDSVDQAEEQVYELHNNFDVKHYTLRSLMSEYDIHNIDLLKLDCEGGENGFLRDDCEDLPLLKNINAIMGEWHGFEDYRESAPTQSMLFNKLRETLKDTHSSWLHDPIKGDGLGIFGFVKR
jgi:FkbM family methyltransferase